MSSPHWQRFRPNKVFWVWVVALVTGLVAAGLARQYLTDQVEHIESRNRGQTVNLVVAKADLPAGTRLGTPTVAVRPVPQDHAHSGAVRPEQFDRIDGLLLAHPLKAGDAVLWSSVEATRPPTFADRIPPGHRAITIPVDDINAMAGMLEPGDLIDLVLVVDLQGRKHMATLLSAVQVLATGQRALDTAGPSSERRLYTTVTLNTNPQQARNVVLAREVGRLTALLRRPQDKAEAPTAPTAPAVSDLALWLGQLNPAPVPNQVAAPEVPVLYGGRSSVSSTAPPVANNLPPRGTSPPVQVQWSVTGTNPVTESQ